MTFHSVTWCNFRSLILFSFLFEVCVPKFKCWWNRAWAECGELKVKRDIMFWLAMTFPKLTLWQQASVCDGSLLLRTTLRPAAFLSVVVFWFGSTAMLLWTGFTPAGRQTEVWSTDADPMPRIGWLPAACQQLGPRHHVLSVSVRHGNNNNNNILDSSQREIKAVVQSHNEEHISIILSHETHAHTHSSTYAPFLSH